MAQMAQNSLVKVDGGYLTIDADTSIITVTHNLGVTPNFAAIWVDTDDYDIIPFGCCVECIYQKNPYTTTGSYANVSNFEYMYQYKHSSSGNLLPGTYHLSVANQLPTSTEFRFVRGNNDWKKLDVNGNALKYRWVVGYIPTES